MGSSVKSEVRGVLFRVVYILLLAVIALVAGEAGVRLFMPMELTSGPKRMDDSYVWESNGLVMWENPVAVEYDRAALARLGADSGHFKIVGLGDSILFGVDVERERTYMSQIRRYAPALGGREVVTVNLGVPGYNIRQSTERYRERGAAVRPDVVIYHVWSDDLLEYAIEGRKIVKMKPEFVSGGSCLHVLPVPEGVNRALTMHSHLYRRLSVWEKEREKKDGRSTDRDSGEWRRELDAMRGVVGKSGARFVVVLSPPMDGGRYSEKVAGETKEFDEIFLTAGLEEGFEVIALDEAFRRHRDEVVTEDDVHFNERGHEIAAREIAARLVKMVGKGGRRPAG